jgi:hypothetical protein
MNNHNKGLLARSRGAMPRFLALTQLLRKAAPATLARTRLRGRPKGSRRAGERQDPRQHDEQDRD